MKNKRIFILLVVCVLVVDGYIILEKYYQNVQKTKKACQVMVSELDSIIGAQNESYQKAWSIMEDIKFGKKGISEITSFTEQEGKKMDELTKKYDLLIDSKHIDCFGWSAKAKK